jgi:SAM-dependent methyltransferase
MLTGLTGMGEKVTFEHVDAVELPFDGKRFDLVWMQHMTMNIKDKRRLFREIRRVLKPGRKVALHEPMLGGGAVKDMHYPVPWDRDGRVSFLIPPGEMRALLEEKGFEVLTWEDVTDAARHWFERVVTRMAQEGPPVLGLHVLLGPEMTVMSSNMLKNIVAGRLRLIRAVLRRPSSRSGGEKS